MLLLLINPYYWLCVDQVLAAQLTNELRALFPNNAVEFFVSYYDYFMPEAFVSASDTYIDKVQPTTATVISATPDI